MNNSKSKSLPEVVGRYAAVTGALGVALLMTTGCEPVAEATPGVYGGKADQLMTGDTAGRSDALQKRFQLVQADR